MPRFGPHSRRGTHRRAVAVPRAASAGGGKFGGSTMLRLDLAGDTFAASHASRRVITARINVANHGERASIVDDVSLLRRPERDGGISLAAGPECASRGDAPRPSHRRLRHDRFALGCRPP